MCEVDRAVCSMAMLKSLEKTFIPDERDTNDDEAAEHAKWRERYAEALETLRHAGIQTRGNCNPRIREYSAPVRHSNQLYFRLIRCTRQFKTSPTTSSFGFR